MLENKIFTAFRNRLVNTQSQALEAAYDEGIFNRALILNCFSEWISEDNY